MITLVDYGCGNIQALANIYQRLEIPVTLASTSADLKGAERIILPGVGSFDWAMKRLETSGMRPALDRLANEQRVPVLGICVGMHMMTRRSDEGTSPGLGWVAGEVHRFDETKLGGSTKLPHMGWNNIEPSGSPLFDRLGADDRFYFLHSYYVKTEQASDVAATTMYGARFTSAFSAKNFHGVQFHPEKSHQWGIQLLKNFAQV